MTILELFRGTILFTTYITSTHSVECYSWLYMRDHTHNSYVVMLQVSIFNFCIARPLYANYFFILTNFAFAFLVAMWDHTHCNVLYSSQLCGWFLQSLSSLLLCMLQDHMQLFYHSIHCCAVVGFTLDCGTIHNHKVINYYKSQQ